MTELQLGKVEFRDVSRQYAAEFPGVSFRQAPRLWQCPDCKRWTEEGSFHDCDGPTLTAILDALSRIESLLHKIAGTDE